MHACFPSLNFALVSYFNEKSKYLLHVVNFNIIQTTNMNKKELASDTVRMKNNE